MTVRTILDAVLRGSRADYPGGLRVFRLLAGEQMRGRYLEFLSEVEDAAVDDIHYRMLCDKLRRIMDEVSASPGRYRDVLDSELDVSQAVTATTAAAAEPEPLDREALGGLKLTTTYDALPEEQRAWYDRIREIVPLEARLHSELTSLGTDAERKELAGRICSLDDERRSLWDRLDAWAKGTGASQAPEEEKKENPVVSGLELARSRKRLKDNIRQARLAVERFTASGDTVKLEAAEKRLKDYLTRLDTLEKEIADEEGRE